MCVRERERERERERKRERERGKERERVKRRRGGYRGTELRNSINRRDRQRWMKRGNSSLSRK